MTIGELPASAQKSDDEEFDLMRATPIYLKMIDICLGFSRKVI
jgi:hypothetical protein